MCGRAVLLRLLTVAVIVLAAIPVLAEGEQSLRLVPFPKEVRFARGRFDLTDGLVISVPDSPAAIRAASDLAQEVKLACCSACRIEKRPSGSSQSESGRWTLDVRTSSSHAAQPTAPRADPSKPESYRLEVHTGRILASANDERGLLWAIQTLRQLVRANSDGRTIPCLDVADYPTLQWRGFQEDITRGPSTKPAVMKREVAMSAFLRMNFFTYYLEHQYEFTKHPEIGPKNGSLTASELRDLVEHSRSFGVDIFGCQQSFGHFGAILYHPEYAKLRETGDILDPTNEESYRLLDDMYSEQAPVLDSSYFNVCCDETFGLGEGPSKALAQKIGVGGVYARHIQRIHDLVAGKYRKKMMMWGDILLMHPENIKDIPKDITMLSWGYHRADTFESAIKPFTDAGFDFFVCPGTSNWSRILPDFDTSVINIRNYVRDGARLGAKGMLNTTWIDDGEGFAAMNWYGVSWGAECAWNGSTTSVEDFNRRIGGVLFGEKGDHFGQAIVLLGKTFTMWGLGGMYDARFWQADMGDLPAGREPALAQARELLTITSDALKHLRLAKKDARVNASILDYYIFGAERMRLIATRRIDFIAAAEAYEAASLDAVSGSRRASIEKSLRLMEGIRGRHIALRDDYVRLWNAERKPYTLDRVVARFDECAGKYGRVAEGLRMALANLKTGKPLPSPAQVGIALEESGAIRRTRPSQLDPSLLRKELDWAVPGSKKRIGFVLKDVGRTARPMEVEIPGLKSESVVLVEVSGEEQTPVPCQMILSNGWSRLAFVTSGDSGSATRDRQPPDRSFLAYIGSKVRATTPNPASVAVREAKDGGNWLENDRIRLLIGSEGGHIFRWEIKGMGGRDVTQPGDSDWAGFADINGVYRNAPNTVAVEAAGPVLARIRCRDANGIEKTFSLWSGQGWLECNLNAPSSWFACYDDVNLLGASSPTPGKFLFADGTTGDVRPYSTSIDSQVKREKVCWSAKYRPGGPMLALLTPEVEASHYIGPGGGMGAMGIQDGPAAAHFVIFGDLCPDFPAQALDSLGAMLDYRSQPDIALHAAQTRAR